jgi:ADP-ribosylglycohydrolase
MPKSGAAMRIALTSAARAGEQAAKAKTLKGRLEVFDHSTETAATDSVAASFGFLLASNGEVFDAISLAVNAGDDTHTTALMTGAMIGAIYGAAQLPSDIVHNLYEVNTTPHQLDIPQVVLMAVEGRRPPLYLASSSSFSFDLGRC